MNNLFFQLIQVAIGTRDGLSRIPSEREWEELYDMADKQSLIGICFAGLLKLGANVDDGYLKIGMSEELFFNWIGTAAAIQQTNKKMNKRCVELQQKLADAGFRSCILKGQGVAQLYGSLTPSPSPKGEGSQDNSNPSNASNTLKVISNSKPMDLSLLRQSGDIDIWVDASRKDIINMVQKIAPTTNVREHHLELEAFKDTEVEVHFWPAVIRHFLKNRKLQKWFDSQRNEAFNNHIDLSNSSNLTICAPTPEFHAVQQMAHMYHHLFDSGIGLRQVMDYYMVLKTLSCSPVARLCRFLALASGPSVRLHSDSGERKGECSDKLKDVISNIGMGRFASAMMWVIKTIFVGQGNDNEEENLFLGIEPNEEDGKFLLGEIMRGGNFGKYDDKKNRNTKNYFSSFYGSIFRNMRYLRFNSFDWFWSPLWRIYYFGWRKINGYH